MSAGLIQEAPISPLTAFLPECTPLDTPRRPRPPPPCRDLRTVFSWLGPQRDLSPLFVALNNQDDTPVFNGIQRLDFSISDSAALYPTKCIQKNLEGCIKRVGTGRQQLASCKNLFRPQPGTSPYLLRSNSSQPAYITWYWMETRKTTRSNPILLKVVHNFLNKHINQWFL